MKEILETKLTRLTKDGLYGCRVIRADTGKPIVELRVEKSSIADAFYDMLRTLDKLGYDSPMANAARHRGKGVPVNAKYIWY
ncbi:hypothetical protein D3C86_1791940 [compost metagenome]